jgi:adenosylcobinamide-GDP ribazoletransferase
MPAYPIVTRTLLGEFVAALTLLTRLPASGLIGGRPWPEPAACVWAYPLVGALVGAAGGAVFWAAQALPPAVASLLAIAAMALLTGGLHEDGLADCADGFGGGHGRVRKLDIMRDSRIGSYGALSLILVVGLRAAALSAMRPSDGAAALLAAGALGRGAMIPVLLLLPPARAEGAAAGLRHMKRPAAMSGLALALATSLVLPHPAMAAGIAGLAAIGTAWLARRQLGGYTGDVLGAAASLGDCAALCAVAIRP